jgi:hypothetical protein
MNISTSPSWSGDVMNRHVVAGFIYTVIQKRQLSTKTTGSICMALDGDWGSGKSFFIERWVKDLKRDGHAVIRFDAWKNDLSDEPLVGLLATLQTETRKFFSTLDVETKVTRKIERQGKKVIDKAKSVLIPASIEVAKGVASRWITREAAEAVSKLIGDEESQPKEKNGLFSEKSIEKVFDKVLDNHVKKQKAIADFTKELAQLATDLETLGKKNLPIYICIDELDRCRPTYAITLLEGVKHLFNAKGVCFVFSTNLAQLSESVKAVYGPGFNGHMYLKRFFDFDYQLPPPDNRAFAELLIKGSIIEHRPTFGGIPVDGSHVSEPHVTQAESFSLIASVFGLDLRSQQQVFTKAEAAASALPEQHIIHLLYLFGLASIHHKNPDAFNSLDKNAKSFSEITSGLIKENISFNFTYHDRSGSQQTGSSTVIAALEKYHSLRLESKDAKIFRTQPVITNGFPDSLKQQVYESLVAEPRIFNIDTYWKLIRLAGGLSNSSINA